MDPIAGFLAAAIRIATPLLWASVGEVIAERAGVINLAVEGAMLAGCLAAVFGALTGDPWTGVAAASMAGMAIAGGFAAVAVWGRTDQIIAGTALTLASVGVTGTLYQQLLTSTGAELQVPMLGPVSIPFLASIPVIGPGLFRQSVLTYLAFGLVPVVWWVLNRTTAGLRLRAVGEEAGAARAIGLNTRWYQTIAVVIGGGLAGIGGAALVLAQVGAFAERMTAGRGFIAIAVVVLGRWHPGGVLVAAVAFGALTALQFAFQAMGLEVPYQFFLMLPYLIALAALTGVAGRVRPPRGLGRTVG